jgi:2-C-methyl-D-erythritol 4-phosphate cytidylyltransferase
LIFAILLAGGSGTRVKGYPLPKQFIEIAGRLLLEWTLLPFLNDADIDEIVIVSHQNFLDKVFNISANHDQKPLHVVTGGSSRQASVFEALKFLSNRASGDDTIIIHDAARVMIDGTIITRGLRKFTGNIGLTALVSSPDTLMEIDANDKLVKVVDRTHIGVIQTPQIFRFQTIYQAHQQNVGLEATDDISLLLGQIEIHYFLGSRLNFKVTTEDDVLIVKSLLEKEASP